MVYPVRRTRKRVGFSTCEPDPQQVRARSLLRRVNRTLTQEQEEQLALDQFRSASRLLPGKEQRVVADPPDFVVTNGAHRTSVETTRYHKDAGRPGGSEAARHEGNEQQLAARAQA